MADLDPMEAEVDAWMQQFAKLEDRRGALPDAGTLWVKARLLQSTAAMERAARPVTRVQIASYVVVAAGWAAMMTWKWSALNAWFNSLRPARIILGAAGAQTANTLSLTFLMVLIALASATAMLAFHTILAEE